MAAGPRILEWDGRDAQGAAVASGVYFVRAETPGFGATRKVALLLRAGAHVQVVSPELCPNLGKFRDEGRIEHVARGYEPGDLEDAFLAIAATDREDINRAVAEAVGEAEADTSCIFVPPAFAIDAIYEAVDAGVRHVVVDSFDELDRLDALIRTHVLADPHVPIPENIESPEIFPAKPATDAEKAQAAGVKVRIRVWKGMFHCFPLMSPLFPEAVEALRETCDFIWEEIGGSEGEDD